MDRERAKAYRRQWARANRALKRIRTSVISDSSSEGEGDVELQCDVVDVTIPCEVNTEIQNTENSTDTGTDDTPDENGNYWDWDAIDEHIQISSSSEAESETDEESLCERLKEWSHKNEIKQNAIDGLLKILQEFGHNVPSTARTLLKTPRTVETEERSGMQYSYLDLRKVLLKNIELYKKCGNLEGNDLHLSFNIDGLPIFKSTSKSLWPVLCAIMNLKPIRVFPVALCYGQTKPKNLDFLQDTVSDLRELMEHGLSLGETEHYAVRVKAIVCDAPAKAMVKSVKLYSGYYGCDKCSQAGFWNGRMTYVEVEGFELRTDASFRAQTNHQHHHGPTPFCDLPIDMIKNFPIDYMHQVCLGVQKRLLFVWTKSKNKLLRMSAGHKDTITLKLINLRKYISSDFARKPRGLDELERWKATEFRQFLLYTGAIVLKEVLRPDMFEHFMVLSVALRILVSPGLNQTYGQYAHGLLKHFVTASVDLYGPEFLVYNVHSLLHLASDAEQYSGLDSCSAFVFENHLQKVKRMVRSSKNPLVQIIKRSQESADEPIAVSQSLSEPSCKRPNNAFIISASSCCEIVNSTNKYDDKGEKLFLCRIYKNTRAHFQHPCDSRIVGIYAANLRRTQMKLLPMGELSKKALLIELDHGQRLFIAILHDI